MGKSLRAFGLAGLAALGFSFGAHAQSQILFQGFEGGGTWGIQAGAANISTDAGATNTPPSQRIRSGTASWQVINAIGTLELSNTAINGFSGRKVVARLASISTTTGNGTETGDPVSLFVALDGAAFGATPDVKITGNNNSRWGYWGTNDVVSTAGVPVTVASPQAGTSTNNPSNIYISIPDAATSIALRVVATNNSTGEVWCMDDLEVVGNAVGGVSAVSSLVATAVSGTQINVSWMPNGATDTVLVAYATNNTFGAPSGSYSASNAIVGGGEVLYVGSLTNVSHLGLAQNKAYYYRAYSFSGGNYSPFVAASATTPINFPPSLSVTNPPLVSNDVANAVAAVTAQGTGVNLAGEVSWSNRNSGATGSGPAATSWTVTNIPLAVGANNLVFSGTNADGFAAASVTTLVYRALPPTIGSPSDATVWINEIHYDNTGGDTNEGIEVAGPAGTDLSGYALTLYNGSTNGVNLAYSNFVLTGTIDDEGCGYGAVWFPLPANGLQNAGGTNPPPQPDGILLSQGTNVLLFLSYEGTLVASDGVGAGYQSIDIGVQEQGNEPIGQSLQLLSAATSYAGFVWAGPLTATPGTLNSNQTISSCGNVPPVLAPIGNPVATNGGVFVLSVNASDTIDGDVVALGASNLPPGAVFAGATNGTNVSAAMTWSPVGAVGVYTTTFFAVDNDGTDSETITITVIPGVPPVLAPLTNVIVWQGNPLAVPVVAFPTEGDVVTLSASNLPAGSTFVSTNENGTFLWASAGPVGVYTTAFYAADDDGVTSRTLVVTVKRDLSQFGTNVVLYQGFEGTDTWSIVEGGAFISTGSGAGEFPSNQRIFAGTSSWQVINASGTLSLASAAISGYTNRCLALRVSSTSTNSGNGADSADLVRVFVALNGAALSTNADVILSGNNNAQWGYDATLQAYTEAGSPLSFVPPQGGLGTNNYAQIVIGLPDNATSLAVRVTANNNFTAEDWNIDDIRVLGSVGFPASTDDDGDLLPNVWEFQYFAGNTNATASDDNDTDGFNNLSEYIAGTIPTNGNSYPRVDLITNSNITGIAVSFASVTGRLYDVQATPDMLSGVWSNLQTGVSGSGLPISVNDNAPYTNRFYRIGIKLAP